MLILSSLAAALACSSLMFWVLMRRATSRRQWVAYSDWARENGFHFRSAKNELPEPLRDLAGRRPMVRICLASGPTLLMQVQTHSADSMNAAGGLNLAADPFKIAAWNLLVRKMEAPWSPTGLRPAGQAASLLDLYSLSSFPLMGEQRFLVFGADSLDAQRLSASSIRALLPPDIGFLLHGRFLILDFSARPFDAIELNRMRALADQLAAKVPARSDD